MEATENLLFVKIENRDVRVKVGGDGLSEQGASVFTGESHGGVRRLLQRTLLVGCGNYLFRNPQRLLPTNFPSHYQVSGCGAGRTPAGHRAGGINCSSY